MPHPWPHVVWPNPDFLSKLTQFSNLWFRAPLGWRRKGWKLPFCVHEAYMSLVYCQVLHVRQLRARPCKYGLKSLAANKRRIALRLLQEVNSSTSGTLYHFLQTPTIYVILPGFTVKVELYMQQLVPVFWWTSTSYLGWWSSYFWKINHRIPSGRKWPFHYVHGFCVLGVPKAPYGWFVSAPKCLGRLKADMASQLWAGSPCGVFTPMSGSWCWPSAGTLPRLPTGVPPAWPFHVGSPYGLIWAPSQHGS